jgi:hypothetical protein
MSQLSYRRHRFPAEIIQHSIWLHLRFTLSYRDVEELLAERGLDVSYETVRRWVLKFGPLIARKLRSCGGPRVRIRLSPAASLLRTDLPVRAEKRRQKKCPTPSVRRISLLSRNGIEMPCSSAVTK